MRKRWVAGLLAVCLCAGILAGCGKDTDGTKSNSSTPIFPVTNTEGTEDVENESTSNTVIEEAPGLVLVRVLVSGELVLLTDDYDEGWRGNTVPGVAEEWICTYDEAGNRLSRMWTGDGQSGGLEWTYDQDGNMLTEIVYLNGDKRTEKHMTYDENGNEVSHIEESFTSGFVITSEYDQYGNVLLIEALENGAFSYKEVYSYDYDESGNMLLVEVVKTSSAANETTASKSWVYDEDGNVLTIVDRGLPGGTTTDYEYDSNGNVTKRTESFNGHVDTYIFEYGANGNRTMTTFNDSDGSGYTIEYHRDAAGNVLEEIKTKYDAAGSESVAYTIVSTYDSNSNALTYVKTEYDSAGVGTVTNSTTNTYHPNGALQLMCKETTSKIYSWEYDKYSNILKYVIEYKTEARESYVLIFEYEELG